MTVAIFHNRATGQTHDIGAGSSMSAHYVGGAHSADNTAKQGYADHTHQEYAKKAVDGQIARSKTAKSKIGSALRGSDKQASVDRKKSERAASKSTYGH